MMLRIAGGFLCRMAHFSFMRNSLHTQQAKAHNKKELTPDPVKKSARGLFI